MTGVTRRAIVIQIEVLPPRPPIDLPLSLPFATQWRLACRNHALAIAPHLVLHPPESMERTGFGAGVRIIPLPSLHVSSADTETSAISGVTVLIETLGSCAISILVEIRAVHSGSEVLRGRLHKLLQHAVSGPGLKSFVLGRRAVASGNIPFGAAPIRLASLLDELEAFVSEGQLDFDACPRTFLLDLSFEFSILRR